MIEEAALTEAAAAAADTIVDDAKKIAEESAPKAEAVDDKGQLLLFTTQKCPNCKLAKEFLSGVDYTVIDAEENSDLAMKYGIMQAPTMVLVDGDTFRQYRGVSDIKGWLSQKN